MKAGDWAVIKDSWSIYVREIKRVTDHCFYAGSNYSNRDMRHDRAKAVFVGTEEAAMRKF